MQTIPPLRTSLWEATNGAIDSADFRLEGPPALTRHKGQRRSNPWEEEHLLKKKLILMMTASFISQFVILS